MFTALLAIDGDKERAIRQARAITDAPLAANSLSVVLVYVAKQVRSDEGPRIDMQEYSDLPESVVLSQEHLKDADIDTTVEWKSGDPADEVIRIASEVDADWIVVGGRKRTPVGKAIFGSVSQEIILNAECAVLVANE